MYWFNIRDGKKKLGPLKLFDNVLDTCLYKVTYVDTAL